MDEIIELLDAADKKIREKLISAGLYTWERDRLIAAREDIQKAVSMLLLK